MSWDLSWTAISCTPFFSCYEDHSTCDSLTNLDRLIFFRGRGEAMRVRVGRSSQTAVLRYERRPPQGCAVGELRKRTTATFVKVHRDGSKIWSTISTI